MNDIFIGGVVTGEKQHHRKRLRRIQFRWQPVVQLSVTRTKIFSICPDGDCVVEITAIVSLSLYTRAHSTRIYIYIYISWLIFFSHPFCSPRGIKRNNTMINIDTVFLLRSEFIAPFYRKTKE